MAAPTDIISILGIILRVLTNNKVFNENSNLAICGNNSRVQYPVPEGINKSAIKRTVCVKYLKILQIICNYIVPRTSIKRYSMTGKEKITTSCYTEIGSFIAIGLNRSFPQKFTFYICAQTRQQYTECRIINLLSRLANKQKV